MYTALKANVLLVEYRGFGNSSGRPSEKGFQYDAMAALDFMLSRTDLDHTKIFVFGSSLGGAVALWLAHQRPEAIAGVIVENTFTSLADMVLVLLGRVIQPRPSIERSLRLFLRVFMTNHWSSIDLIGQVRVPILFMVGTADELIPPKHMRLLYDTVAADVPKKLHEVPGGEHNTTFYQGGQPYYDAFGRFLHQCIRDQANVQVKG